MQRGIGTSLREVKYCREFAEEKKHKQSNMHLMLEAKDEKAENCKTLVQDKGRQRSRTKPLQILQSETLAEAWQTSTYV